MRLIAREGQDIAGFHDVMLSRDVNGDLALNDREIFFRSSDVGNTAHSSAGGDFHSIDFRSWNRVREQFVDRRGAHPALLLREPVCSDQLALRSGSREKFLDRNLKGSRDSRKVQERWISFSGFEVSDRGSGDIGQTGE